MEEMNRYFSNNNNFLVVWEDFANNAPVYFKHLNNNNNSKL